jgi:CheY-like chemotaxis protein
VHWGAPAIFKAMKNATFTILIVEDNTDDQIFIRKAFQVLGDVATLQITNNGAEAIAYLKGEGKYADRETYVYPSFIITDLKMPGTDGFDLLNYLKNNPTYRIIPTVVLTSSQDLHDIKTAYALGASSYHVKPSHASELRALIKSIYDYWMTCEVPQVDKNGKQLTVISKGKLGERFVDL